MQARKSRFYDKLIEHAFFIIGLSCVFILLLIILFLFKEGIPILKTASLTDFIFGSSWYSTGDPPRFGIFPLIVASLAVTFLAAVIAVPLSLAVGYIFPNSRRRRLVKSSSRLLRSSPRFPR